MQEALARLCGQSINQIKGTRFEFCPRRDANGEPLEAPYHPELKTQLDHLSFMMYDRQQELDNCRDYSNHKSAIIKTKDQTIAMLAKDRKSPPSARQEGAHHCPSSPPHLIFGGDH